jgi:hypothetical protein
MKQRKRRQDWPILFFSNIHERIIEISSPPDLPPSSFRACLLPIDPDFLRMNESSMRDWEGAVLIQRKMDVLPFLNQSLDGIIILLSPEIRGMGKERDEDGLRRMLSEAKRTLKRKGRILIFLKNKPLACFTKRHPLKIVLKILKEMGCESPEVLWPYRNLKNVKRLILLMSTNVERHCIHELTILKRSEGNLVSFLKYFYLMGLSQLGIFSFMVPRGYLIITSR